MQPDEQKIFQKPLDKSGYRVYNYIRVKEKEVLKMTKATMMKWYNCKSAADSYIVGFIDDGKVYFSEIEHIAPRYLNVEQASRNQGENLRFRLKKKYKKQLLKKGATCIGDKNILVGDYNKGEMFEKAITEYFGQEWEKDTIPFWVQGDIRIDNTEIQIKFDGATLLNTKQIEKFKKRG